MFRVRHFAFSLAIIGVVGSLPIDFACQGAGPLPAHPSRVSRGKASALVRMVDENPKGGGPEMNLAPNGARRGRPSAPRLGAVVVWPHYVGMITGQTADGRWIVRSGNDSGRVREWPRSVAGAVFRI